MVVPSAIPIEFPIHPSKSDSWKSDDKEFLERYTRTCVYYKLSGKTYYNLQNLKARCWQNLLACSAIVKKFIFSFLDQPVQILVLYYAQVECRKVQCWSSWRFQWKPTSWKWQGTPSRTSITVWVDGISRGDSSIHHRWASSVSQRHTLIMYDPCHIAVRNAKVQVGSQCYQAASGHQEIVVWLYSAK